MKIYMAGIDYNKANIETRELFSFTKEALEKAYDRLLKNHLISGSVIISTCNRTELYISCSENANIEPFNVLCGLLNIYEGEYSHLSVELKGDLAIKHLCDVACGIKSQIWGEDQIISQVKNAIFMARKMKAADSTLEVIFRNAVAAAKKVRTAVKLNYRESSIVYEALDVIKKRSFIKNILIIGNGEIGRLMAKVLIENGYNATITLRQYKHGVNEIPNHAKTANYSERYLAMEACQCVVSATLSPHYTITAEKLKDVKKPPKVYIDLAVPRDIEPSVTALNFGIIYDVDSLHQDKTDETRSEKLKEIDKITDKYIKAYHDWDSYKEGLCI